jgi:hypothetical protein
LVGRVVIIATIKAFITVEGSVGIMMIDFSVDHLEKAGLLVLASYQMHSITVYWYGPQEELSILILTPRHSMNFLDEWKSFKELRF